MDIIIPVAKVIAAIACVIIVYIFASAVINTGKLRRRDESLARSGRTATAKIESFKTKSVYATQKSPVVIELAFTADSGERVLARRELDLASSLFARRYMQGNTVTVLYNPAEPRQFRLVEPDIVQQY